MKHEGWNKARDIRYFFEEHQSESYTQLRKRLKFIESRMEAYGDRILYVDSDGNYWEDYYSIGD